MGEREALILLAHCVEPGDATCGRLIGRHGAAAFVSMIERGQTGLSYGEGLAARMRGVRPESAAERAAGVDARIITRVDREWPTQLDELGARAPIALWVRGAADLRLLALRSVAMVGARACTAYGEEVAFRWAAELATARWTVVSGAAFGIDAAAHRGALLGGTTIAMLAGGVDVAYPRAHEALLARIADDGLVVSEAPPGEHVRRQRFLSRNRLIAACTRATIVVEAAERSGTAATARSARELSRIVLAVPGPVVSPASAGCHRMIREGDALLVSDVDDVRGLLDLDSRAEPGVSAQQEQPPRQECDALADRERRVLDSLRVRSWMDSAEVLRSCGLGASEMLAALSILTARGLVDESESGWRISRGVSGPARR